MIKLVVKKDMMWTCSKTHPKVFKLSKELTRISSNKSNIFLRDKAFGTKEKMAEFGYEVEEVFTILNISC